MISRTIRCTAVLAALVALINFSAAQTVAFPGALGFGAYASGGRNGTPFANYFVLQSSSLTTWARIATNQFDGNGGFSFTTNAPAGVPQNFYRLQLP